MAEFANLFRWIHILSGAAWFGEVLLIVFVLVPSVTRLEAPTRASYVGTVFPRVFRVASMSVALVLLSGLGLNYALTGWRDIGAYIQSTPGLLVTVGGVLGLLLGLFHFVIEARIEKRVLKLVDQVEGPELEKLMRYLRIIPRVGLGILVLVFLSMMIAARGF